MRADASPRTAARAIADWMCAGAYRTVGVHGIQGSGKTTVCRALVAEMARRGRSAVVLSLDDFYLPHGELGGAWRGRPGTHDLAWLGESIRTLLAGGVAEVPVYDKTRRSGRGDRVGVRVERGPVDHLLVEGWCIGYQPLDVPPAALAQVNCRLRAQHDAVYAQLDACVVLQAEAECAYRWREAAEAEARQRGEALTAAEVAALVDHCMPVYAAFEPTVLPTPLPKLLLPARSAPSAPAAPAAPATSPPATADPIRLSAAQSELILAGFRDGPTLAAAHAWSRRQYAPMHIHRPELADVRAQIRRRWPDHVITFDVLFEAPGGTPVDYHSDYESLGPFAYAPWASIQAHDFVSVHFNLTADGGRLCTLDWPLLSWLHHAVIVRCGIYSRPHRLLNALCRPLFWLSETRHPNAVNAGNSFDNLRLHRVARGAARISYVVRLARAGVRLTHRSLRASAGRSPACQRLADVLGPHVAGGGGALDVAAVPWERVEGAP